MSTYNAEQAKSASQFVAEARQSVPELTLAQAKEELEQGHVNLLLDVREPAEWEKDHIPGVLLDPRGMLRTMYLYCFRAIFQGMKKEGAREKLMRWWGVLPKEAVAPDDEQWTHMATEGNLSYTQIYRLSVFKGELKQQRKQRYLTHLRHLRRMGRLDS